MAASNVTNSPVYTRLIDDSSPFLLFDPASAWNHTAEDGPDLYVNSTYSSSDVSGATCTFSFNGTGFSVLGARKPDYGEYLILLDGAVQQFSNATAQQTQFGQVLGGASGLADGLHTVVFMAAGGGPVDIDAIVYERTDKEQSGGHAGIQTTSAPSASSSETASASSVSSSETASAPSPSSSGFETSSSSTSSSSETSSVSSSDSSQTAATPTPSSGNRISANPHAQGPDESAPSQNASATPVSSSSSVTPSASSQSSPAVSSATASSDSSEVPPSSQPNAQPSDESTVTAQPTAQPGPSGPTRSGTSSALGPSISQAEQANSPQIAGTSQPQKGLPTGAIVGICLGLAAALLLIVALLFCLMRRRRRAATARRRMTAGLPSPTLPLQDPSRHASYFFGGRGNNANAAPSGGNGGMRELYLAQGPQNPVTMQGRANPGTLKPMAPTVMRDSVHSNSDTATLASEDGYFTDASSIKRTPTRPPRPPNVRLSIV